MRFFCHTDIKLPEIGYACPKRAWDMTKRMEIAIIDRIREETKGKYKAYGKT